MAHGPRAERKTGAQGLLGRRLMSGDMGAFRWTQCRLKIRLA